MTLLALLGIWFIALAVALFILRRRILDAALKDDHDAWLDDYAPTFKSPHVNHGHENPDDLLDGFGPE